MVCFNLLPQHKQFLIGYDRSDICYGCDKCIVPFRQRCCGLGTGICGNRIVPEWGFCIKCINTAPAYTGPRQDWLRPFP